MLNVVFFKNLQWNGLVIFFFCYTHIMGFGFRLVVLSPSGLYSALNREHFPFAHKYKPPCLRATIKNFCLKFAIVFTGGLDPNTQRYKCIKGPKYFCGSVPLSFSCLLYSCFMDL